jgi:hypothetical protein
MKIKIDTLRQIIRLLGDKELSLRAIGRACRISPNTAKSIQTILTAKQFTSTLQALDGEKLQRTLFEETKPTERKPISDWQ